MNMIDNPALREVRYAAPDGLILSARVYDGTRGKLPVVCLAGLSRNARDFDPLAVYLSGAKGGRRTVVSFDYRGRGRSAYDPDWRNYNVVTEADDIIAGLAALDIGHAAFIGTSRGGIILHLLAGMRPGALKAAVLNDIGPEIGGAGLAQIKSYLARAPKPADFADAVRVQKTIHGKAFPALADKDWDRIVRAIYREDKGRIVPDYDPRLLKTLDDLDLNDAIPSMWPQFNGLTNIPLLAIRGENSQLLTAETLAKMSARHPRMTALTVAGQGHAPMLETGDLPARIAAFIAEADHPLVDAERPAPAAAPAPAPATPKTKTPRR